MKQQEHEDWLVAADVCLTKGYFEEAVLLIDKVLRECKGCDYDDEDS